MSPFWLYRHFPDKPTLVGAAIIRLIEVSWAQAAAELADIDGFEARLVAGVKIGRRAYDDPGTLLMRIRLREPENSWRAPVRVSKVWCPTWLDSGDPTWRLPVTPARFMR